MKWTEKHTVSTLETDMAETVTVSAILRLFQNTANLQCKNIRPSNEELRERGYAFVVSRMNLSIYKPLFAYDGIEVSTWACESRGAAFNRCFEIKRDGMKVAEAASVWALLDIGSKRICRVADFTEGYLAGDFEPMVELDSPKRIKIPESARLALDGEYRVSYRDADLNGHMNNTVYADFLCGFLPMEGKRVSTFSICYQSEAPLGCELKIYVGADADEEGKYYLRTVKDDGRTNVEAEIMLESI